MDEVIKTQDVMPDFERIGQMIENAHRKAARQVNETVIDLYWEIGQFVSEKTENDGWGKSTVKKLSEYIAQHNPNASGFSDQNIWRMKRFYETYKAEPDLMPLLKKNTWSNNLHIMVKCTSMDERKFYLELAAHEGYSARELARQIDSAYCERLSLSDGQASSAVNKKSPAERSNLIRDQYMLEFLSLPEQHREYDLKRAIVENMKSFILEVGRDFTFIGEEYRVQVGGNDYYIDLLFYHRGLQCLVAFELKIDDFKPEYLGKMSFYLNALDETVRKPHENPSVGIILCKSKEDDVVKFAMNKNLSQTMISEYRTQLIDKEILRKRLSEIYDNAEEDIEE